MPQKGASREKRVTGGAVGPLHHSLAERSWEELPLPLPPQALAASQAPRIPELTLAPTA